MENNKNKKQNKRQKNFLISKYLKKHSLAIAIYLLIYIVSSVSTILITIITANTIQFITEGLWNKAIFAALIVLGLTIVAKACACTTTMIYNNTTAKFTQELNSDLAAQAFKLNSNTYTTHDAGTFVQRIVEDPARIMENLTYMVDGLSRSLSSIVVFVYIATLNLWLGLLMVALMVFCVLLEAFRTRARHKNYSLARRKRDKVHSLTNEIVRSEKDIKSMGLEEKLSEETRKFYGEYQRLNRKAENQDTVFWATRNLLVEAGTIAVLILGIFFMRKELITLATFMIIYTNSSSLNGVAWDMGNILNLATDIKISVRRIASLFDEKEFVTEKFGTVELPLLDGGGRITFSHVVYAYKTCDYFQQNNKDSKKHSLKKNCKNSESVPAVVTKNKVFEDLSFEIQPNATVAFVGKSGSGKSTILDLMCKMHVADSGQVLLNGVDINDLTKQSLRKAISLVNQFPYIFNMSIKENLLLAKKEASDEEILKALKDANLLEFVQTLPKGVDTIVGEGGIRLSGGQRQRLAIARALLRNSSIIIFDESTSSLDNFAQEEVKKSIDALKGKSTIVIVAHRLSTIKNVDHIFFLDEGKIVDEGTFEELFDKNEKFKTMFMAENI